jgi:hypothetical protein
MYFAVLGHEAAIGSLNARKGQRANVHDDPVQRNLLYQVLFGAVFGPMVPTTSKALIRMLGGKTAHRGFLLAREAILIKKPALIVSRPSNRLKSQTEWRNIGFAGRLAHSRVRELESIFIAATNQTPIPSFKVSPDEVQPPFHPRGTLRSAPRPAPLAHGASQFSSLRGEHGELSLTVPDLGNKRVLLRPMG